MGRGARLESGRDPRERHRPDARPVAAARACARDRRRPDRRRRRHARDGTRKPRGRRPRRPLRPPGLHRLARPLPELGGRAAPDRLEGAASLEEALDAGARGPGRRPARAAGCAARAGGAPTGPSSRRGRRSTRSRATSPAALVAKDYHSLWLNSAALARADGDLQVPGGVVERDEQGEPTGVLREESAWRFKERYVETTDDEYLDAMRGGLRLAASRGVTAVHDKDGWLPAIPRLWQRLHARGPARACASGSRCRTSRSTALAELGVAPGIGDDRLRLGYLKVFMDGTLGSQTALMLDGPASRSRAARSSPRSSAAARGPAGPSPCTRSATWRTANALDAFEETRDGVGSRSGSGTGSSTPSAWHRRTSPRFARLGVAASVQFSHAPSDRDAGRAVLARAGSTARTRSAASRTRARVRRQRLGRADRGARPVGRHLRGRARATGAPSRR